MSLYSSEPTAPKSYGPIQIPQKFFQIGFVVLAITMVVRLSEWIILVVAPRWKEIRETWTKWDYLAQGLYCMLAVAFVVLVFRFLRKANNKPMVKGLLALTVIACIASQISYALTYVFPNSLPSVLIAANILGVLDCTGRPITCIFYPFMHQSEDSFRTYLLYVYNLDVSIRFLFLGLALAKYRVHQGLVRRPHTEGQRQQKEVLA
jgi:hypothetical protein